MNFLPSAMLFAAFQAGPALAATAPPSSADGAAAAQPALRCEAPVFGRDTLTVACQIDAGAAPQRLHIKVHFTGSHDDTTASMEVAIGGRPAACDPGSKTSTEAEEGEVTLDCSVAAAGAAGAATVVRASAKWFHAQFVDLEINGRRP